MNPQNNNGGNWVNQPGGQGGFNNGQNYPANNPASQVPINPQNGPQNYGQYQPSAYSQTDQNFQPQMYSNQPNWPGGMGPDKNPAQYYQNHTALPPTQNFQNQPGQYNYNQQGPALAPAPSSTPKSRLRNPKRYDKPPLIIRLVDWFKKNWWAPAVGVVILTLFGMIFYQILIPQDQFLAGVSVDGNNVGGMKKSVVIDKLNKAYSEVPTEVYFGKSSVPYVNTKAADIGVTVDNTNRFKDVNYSLWLRLVPTSVWWAGSSEKVGPAEYIYDDGKIDNFVAKKLGQDCKIKPENATIKVDDGQLVVVGSQAGGTCDLKKFKENVKKAQIKNSKIVIRTDMDENPPGISDAVARELADNLNKRLKDGLPMKVKDGSEKISSAIVKSWLDFQVIDKDANGQPQAPRRVYVVNRERLDKYLSDILASRVEKKPGVTKISTRDFQETSRQTGPDGIAIDVEDTARSAEAFISGGAETSELKLMGVAAKIEYSRSYTPTQEGMNALTSQFVSDNGGNVGVYYYEDSGKKPLFKAFSNENKVMSSNGAEGMYLAYAAQAAIEDNLTHPKAQIGNKNVETCMKEAITSQNKECITGLISRVGAPKATEYLRRIGLQNTSFTETGATTSAADLGNFLYRIMKKEANISDYSRLESPMRQIRSRNGLMRGIQEVSNDKSFVGIVGDLQNNNYAEAVISNYSGRFIIGVIGENLDVKKVKDLGAQVAKLKKEKLEQK